jgi:hypothetical protein
VNNYTEYAVINEYSANIQRGKSGNNFAHFDYFRKNRGEEKNKIEQK